MRHIGTQSFCTFTPVVKTKWKKVEDYRDGLRCREQAELIIPG